MYYGDFDCREDVTREFGIDSFEGTVIRAQYDRECYDGSAFVIFVHDRKFYLVHGSHCSCYGLEDQWSPEEMTAEALVHIIRKGHVYGVSQNEDLAKLIERVDKVKGSPDTIEYLVRQQ